MCFPSLPPRPFTPCAHPRAGSLAQFVSYDIDGQSDSTSSYMAEFVQINGASNVFVSNRSNVQADIDYTVRAIGGYYGWG